jgi:CRP-like cAMP-binding protein
LGYFPLHFIQSLQIPSLIIPFAALLLLTFGSYYAAPVVRPRRRSAAAGAFICIALYILLSLVFDGIINPARYNFLYGALGNLILLLARVYFFFIFFFFGAEFTFVIDSFDALLFVRFIKIESDPRIKKNSLAYRLFTSSGGPLTKYRRSYKEGETVFSQGELDREVYYMLSGEAKFYLDTGSEESPEHKTGTIREGTFFGEVGYLLSQGRSATVKASADITVMVLPPDLFEKIMRMDLLTDQRLIETLSERLKHSDMRLNAAGISTAGGPAGSANPEPPSCPESAEEAGS